MRVICKIDEALASNMEWQQHLLNGDEVRSVIKEHRVADEERWWNMYHSKYPDFTIGEIAKMVRSGILED